MGWETGWTFIEIGSMVFTLMAGLLRGIPVTHDVEKVRFKDLSIPSKEVKCIEEQRSPQQIAGDKK